MTLSKQPYKGTRDFYPEDFRIRQYIFDKWRIVAESFGYEPYDAPSLEPLDLYRAKTGQEIVDEQTYAFTDRGGREVAIRPEMTPTVARMVAAKRQELSYPLRWYSIPDVWRYERPQRGRLREHWQLNVDIFGVESAQAELELIQMSAALMSSFGASDDMYKIRLNSRQLLRVLLKDYFQLDDEKYVRVAKLIDRMRKMDEHDFEQQLTELVEGQFDELHGLLHASDVNALPESVRQFAAPVEQLLADLGQIGVGSVEFDLTLTRGFDYYTDIVFEVFDTDPINSRSLFGGGRYDGLVSLFGVHDLSAVGFGVGDVTMRDFLETHKLVPDLKTETQVYIAVAGEVLSDAQKIASQLRECGVSVAVDLTGRKLDAQIKTADKKGITHVLFVGEKELSSGKYELKNLASGKSESLEVDQIATHL